MDANKTFDAPVLFFGGPYSNVHALRAVLAEAQRRAIPPSHIVCTGDVVAYCGDPKACVDLVRAARIHVVQGNCEAQLGRGADDCGCGFAPGSSCDLLSGAWFAHAARELDADDRAWMAALPARLDLTIAGCRLCVVHGSLGDTSRFVFASAPARVKALDLDAADVDGIVAGHCGLPFSQSIGERFWHNPGVVGMPANDGTARVWFSVLSPGSTPRSLIIEHATLAYDHTAAATTMRVAKLPEGYADALTSGLWPSCDVLPPAEAKQAGVPLIAGRRVWEMHAEGTPIAAWPCSTEAAPLDRAKFHDVAVTADGERRAHVEFSGLKTLWINTGTLCNLACDNCYIESTPHNDRLAYITAAEVATFLDEVARDHPQAEMIGFTGGEPFMNRDLPAMLGDVLARGLKAFVLTNAMAPMRHRRPELLALRAAYGDRLVLRVSLDHYTRALHELERGRRSWQPTLEGLVWLARNGFSINVAGRLFSGEAEGIVRAGYARLFADKAIRVDAFDPVQLVLFPEMDARVDVPEITERCWALLGKSPRDVMCASSRMVVKRRGAAAPAVLACTLVADDPQFELGATLREATRPVSLNHPHCAKFCVLGGAACSAG